MPNTRDFTQHSGLRTFSSGALILAVTGILTVASGCRQDDTPPPRMAFDGDVKVAPVRAADVVTDAALLAPAATAEEAAKPSAAKGGAEAAAIAIDDSTAEGVAKAYAEMMSTGQLAQLPGIVVPDQKDAVQAMAGAIGPAIEAVNALKKAWTEKFPDQPMQVPLSVGGGKVTVAGTEPNAADPNVATATFQVEGTDKPTTRKLRKVEEKWRLEEAELPPAEMLPKMEAMATAIKGVAEQISGGQLADAPAATKALTDALMAAMQGGAAPNAGEAAQPNPTPAPAPDAGAAAPKKPREKGELEQGVDDAAGRSIMGGGL